MEHEQGTWFNFLYRPPFSMPEWVPPAIPLAILALLLIAFFSYFAMRPRRRIPTGPQNAMEGIVEWLNGLARQLLGDRGPHFVPFLGTFFLYIWVMNLMGLIPGFVSPTANLNVTLGLAIIVFLVVQYFGVRENGLLGYLRHFTGDIWWLVPLIFPIHVVGELTRPVTLAMRLFGNVMGGETVIMVLAGLSPILFAHRFGAGYVIGLPIPVALPMILLEIFTGTVQALVFTLLAAAYLAGVMEHQEATT